MQTLDYAARRPLDYAAPRPRAPGRPIATKALLVIFGIVVGVIAFRLLSDSRTPSFQSVAIQDLIKLSVAVEQFHKEVGRYPTTAEGTKALLIPPPGLTAWRGPYILSIGVDPWDKGYVYTDLTTPDGRLTGYEIRCAGPDGKWRTPDDIVNGRSVTRFVGSAS